MAKMRRFHLERKVRWHRGSGRWVVTIGRVLTKRGKLADKDWYFLGKMSQQEANAGANDLAQRWAVICRNWARTEQPLLESFAEPFPAEPRWNTGGPGAERRKITPEEARRLEDEYGIPEDLIIQSIQDYTLAGFVAFYGESREEEMKRKTFRHTSWRKLIGQMKKAATFFPEDVPAKDLNRVHFREARAKMYEHYASRTVRNYMAAALELMRHVYKEFRGDASVPQGIVDACSVPKAARTDINIYGLEEIGVFLQKTKGTISQLDLMLALNCAMYPQDIGRLLVEEIDLKDGSIFWDREKEPANPFRLHHVLWPETLRLLKRYINGGKETGTEVLDYRRGPDAPEVLDPSKLAFLDRSRARYWATPAGHDKDWVSKRLRETVKGVSFRDLRKSANQLFIDTLEGEDTHEHTKDVQELSHRFLGQKTDALVRTYRTMGKRAYVRMNRSLKELGDRLRKQGLFKHIAP